MTKKTYTVEPPAIWQTSNENCTCTEFIKTNDYLSKTNSNKIYQEKNDATKSNSEQIDKGYAWIILCLCIVLQCLAMATIGTYGILIVNIVDATDYSTGFISLYGNLAFVSFTITSLFTGPFISAYGCRKVMIVASFIKALSYILTAFIPEIPLILLTLGIIQGIGLACFFVCPATVVSYWFLKYRSLALGCVASGQSLGLFFWSPFAAYLTDTYGWRGGILLIGGCLLNAIVLSALLHSPTSITIKQERVENTKNPLSIVIKKLANKDLLKNKLFILFAFGNFFSYYGHCTPQTMLPRKIADLGFSNLESAFVLGISGIVGGIVRIIIGSIADLKYFDKIFMTMMSNFILGILTICTIFYKTYTAFSIYSALHGVFSAIYISMLSPVVLIVVDLDHSAQALAWILVLVGIAISSVLSINGLLYDLFNDASFSLFLAGVMFIISSIFHLILWILKKRSKQSKF